MTSAIPIDLFVIGAGSGGVRAARMSAQQGASVVIAESRWMGGTCVNAGCVPKKLYYYAAHARDEAMVAKSFGWQCKLEGFNWSHLRDQKKQEIHRLNQVYENLLLNTGVKLLRGHAKLLGNHRVAINEQIYQAKRILIATGGTPMVPNLQGKEHFITSDEIFDLDTLPASLAILGGGYIAVEFASIFQQLGVDVTLLYRGELFLRGFDEEIRQFVAEEMQKKGVTLRFSTNIESVERTLSGLCLHLNTNETLSCDRVMAATGRLANTASLGLENTQIQLDKRGFIEVNNTYETAESGVFAIGDVIGRVALTPVALAEGMLLANQWFGNTDTRNLSYQNIPTAVFCQPSIASVGLTEEEAVALGQPLAIFTTRFNHMKHSFMAADTREKVLMKVIVDETTDKVLGVHVVGGDAAEIIQGIAVAMNAGLTKRLLDQTIGIHPSAAEELVTMRTVTRRVG